MGGYIYKADIADVNGTLGEVLIYDFDSGTSPETEIILSYPSFDLRYDSKITDVIIGGVIPSEATVYVIKKGNTLDPFLEDLRDSDDKRFLLEINKDGSLFWRGILLSDFSGFADKHTDIIELKALDGLGLLKDIDFDDQDSFLDIIIAGLSEIDTSALYGGSDSFVKVKTNWTDTRIPSTIEPLDAVRLGDAVNTEKLVWNKVEFIKGYDNTEYSEITAQSYYDVITHILTRFQSILLMQNGSWYITQRDLLPVGGNTFKVYSKTPNSASIGTSTEITNKTSSQSYGSSLIRSDGNFNYLVGLKSARVNYLTKNNGSLLPESPELDTSYTTPVLSTGTGNFLDIDIDIYTEQSQVGYDPIDEEIVTQAVFELTIQIGTYFLAISFPTGGYYWTTTPSTVQILTDRMKMNDFARLKWKLITQDIPTSSDATIELAVGTIKVISDDGTGTYSHRHTINNFSVKYIVNNLEPANYVEFKADNTKDFSLIYEFENSLFGTSGTSQSSGALQTYNGTSWDYSGKTWKLKSGSDALYFNELLINELLSLQEDSRFIWSGKMHDKGADLLPINSIRIVWKSTNYDFVLKNITYSFRSGLWSGDWVEVNRFEVRNVTRTITRDPNQDLESVNLRNFLELTSLFSTDFGETKTIKNITVDTSLVGLDAKYWILVDTSSGAITLTLPDSSGLSNNIVFEITFIDDTNSLTIACGGSDTFADASTSFEGVLDETYKLRIDLSNGIWRVV